MGPLFGGYTLAVVGPTLGQPTFYESLNLVADPTAPGYGHTGDFIGIANGIFFAAGFLGTFVAGACGDYFGRVGSLRIAAAIGIIGGTIQTAAVNQAMVNPTCFIMSPPVLLTRDVVSGGPSCDWTCCGTHDRGAADLLCRSRTSSFSRNDGRSSRTGHCRRILLGWLDRVSFDRTMFYHVWFSQVRNRLGCYFSTTSSFGWRFPNAIVILLAILLLLGTLMSMIIQNHPAHCTRTDQVFSSQSRKARAG